MALGSTQPLRNEYQEHFLGGKSGRCVRLTTLPPSCAVVKKSGNLNFLEPSGPLRACNGTALPSFSPLALLRRCVPPFVKGKWVKWKLIKRAVFYPRQWRWLPDSLQQSVTAKCLIQLNFSVPVQACYRPRGFQEVEAPRFRDGWHKRAVRL